MLEGICLKREIQTENYILYVPHRVNRYLATQNHTLAVTDDAVNTVEIKHVGCFVMALH